MSLNPLFVTTQDLDSYYVDRDTGLPLAGGILTFYSDSQRTVLKDVFQLTGSPPNYGYVALPNPLTLSAVGTVQNASGDNVPIYYYPFDADGNVELYYVTCTDSAGVEQFTREGWPNGVASENPQVLGITFENQIANPTFTNTFLNSGANSFTVSGTNQEFPIAPDWTFVCSGGGTLVVQQVPVTGNDDVITNPPYYLDVNVGIGITKCWLRQRFYLNPGLWGSLDATLVYLSSSLIAENQVGLTGSIQMFYSDVGNADLNLLTATFGGSFTRLFGSSPQVPQSNNPNSGQNGFVDVYLSFDQGSHIRVSSIQVVPVLQSTPIFGQDLNSSNRNEAFQGDWYIPRLNFKQVPSFLTGWDFALNPFQFGASSATSGSPGPVTTTAQYIVDQTVACAATSNVAWTSDNITDGIQFTGSGTNDAFYIMQYLQGSQVQRMIGQNLSVNIFGTLPNSANPVTARIYLYRSISTGSIPTLPISIGTINSSGLFTLTAANWEAIGRQGLPIPQAALNQVSTDPDLNSGQNDFGFSGWQINDAISNASTNDCFAIVVTFAYTNPSTVFTINSISLIPGDIPCRPAPQTTTDVLSECRYYYQKSFIGTQVPVDNLGFGFGESYGIQVVAAGTTSANGPIIRFPVTMRVRPRSTLYNPVSGTANQIYSVVGGAWANSVTLNPSAQGFTARGDTPGGSAVGTSDLVQWTSDARLGIV